MTVQNVQNGQPQQAPPASTAEQAALHQLSLEATTALLQAIKVAAQISAVAKDTREMDEGGKAALNFAQAVVLLDPTLSTEGVPLQHQVDLANLQHQHSMLQGAQQAKARAAAPTPSRSV